MRFPWKGILKKFPTGEKNEWREGERCLWVWLQLHISSSVVISCSDCDLPRRVRYHLLYMYVCIMLIILPFPIIPHALFPAVNTKRHMDPVWRATDPCWKLWGWNILVNWLLLFMVMRDKVRNCDGDGIRWRVRWNFIQRGGGRGDWWWRWRYSRCSIFSPSLCSLLPALWAAFPFLSFKSNLFPSSPLLGNGEMDRWWDRATPDPIPRAGSGLCPLKSSLLEQAGREGLALPPTREKTAVGLVSGEGMNCVKGVSLKHATST